MKEGRASATAKIIAASTIYLANDRRHAWLVPPDAQAWSQRLLAATAGDRLLAWSATNAVTRRCWRALEQWTLPGITAHYWRRKRWIEARTRVALAEGFSRVIVLGAGFDTLCLRLPPTYPEVDFVEIDHPATQSAKMAALAAGVGSGSANVTFLAADLDRQFLPEALRDDRSPTLVIAEGLFMYFDQARVEELLGSLRQFTAPSVRLIFSYMVRWPTGAPGFRPASRGVDLWLSWRGEPFKWMLAPEAVSRFLDGQGFELALMVSPPDFVETSTPGSAVLLGENLVECDAGR